MSEVINLTSGDDTRYNYTSNATIYAFAGNDHIENRASNVLINGGNDSDSIWTNGSNNTINGEAGNDYFYIWSDNSQNIKINGGIGNDSIYVTGANNTIFSGDDEDFIHIYLDSNNILVYGEAGNDTIEMGGYNVTAYGGIGNDYFYIYTNAYNQTLYGGEGKDTVYSGGQNVFISSGADNDYIHLFDATQATTVNAGTGNDTIKSYATTGTVFQYNYGDGYDSIWGYNSNDTISIGGGVYKTLTSGTNVIISVAATNSIVPTGAITLSGASGKTLNIIGTKMTEPVTLNNTNSNTLISGSSGNDSIRNNNGSKVTIITGAGNDTIYNSLSSYKTNTYVSIVSGDGNDSIYNHYGSAATILAGAGNDTIYDASWRTYINGGDDNDSINAGSSYDTIDGGNGNDTIQSSGYGVSINGGAGDDKITLKSGSYTGRTVKGGTGNDLISLSSGNNLIQYALGDGYDTIYGATSSDTLTITSGSYTTVKNGNDLIVSVGSGSYYTGAITFKNTTSLNIYPTLKSTFTEGNDTYSNSISNTILSALGGNDYIYNTAQRVTIDGGAGNDSVRNTADYVKMIGGTGADTIYNFNSIYTYAGRYVSIDGGTDNDYILTYGNYVTVNAGDGNDTVNVDYSGYNSINGGAGNDRISLYSSSWYGNYKPTIKGGTGNDTIYGNSLIGSSGNGILYQYSSGDGYDIIYGYTSYDTISLSGGYYTRETVGSNVIVSLVSGGAITLNGASYTTINITGGTLSVTSSGGQNISNSNSNTVISTGSYKDTISNTGNTVKIYSGSGDDSIYSNASYNVTISSGDGNDKIYNAFANTVSIDAGLGNDSIYGNNNWATINGGKGNDTIVGNHWRSMLNGNDGADFISLTTYYYDTIDGGSGNDTIIAGGYEHSVAGGSGNDYISLSGGALTIQGGKGNDTIYGDSTKSHLYQYKKGDGNDIIYNYGSSDSITISGSTWKKTTSGNNVIIKVANSGNITLVGAKGKTLNIYPNKGDNDLNTPQDVILKFMKALDDTTYTGEDAMDAAVKACSNYSGIQSLINKLYRECKSYVDADPTNGWKNFLLEKCDIDLDNDDTGAITGADAGGDTEKTATSVIPETGTRNTSFSGNSFTTNGATFKLGDGRTFKNLSSDEKFIWQSMYSYWAEEGLNLIEESYGYSFADSETKCNTIYIYFTNSASNGLAWTSTPQYNNSTQRAATLNIGVNLNYYYNFSNSDVNGISPKNQEYLDRTFTHEMVHAIMGAKVKQWLSLPISIIEGTAELVKGVDDTRAYNMQVVTQNPEYLKYYLNVNDHYYQDKTSNMYAAGYILLRYLAKQASNGTDSDEFFGSINLNENTAGVSIKGAVISLSTKFTENYLDLENYSALVTKVDASKLSNGVNIYANTSANSIKGGKGADKIYGDEGNDSIFGGKGKDILYGEKDNDLLKGDAGNDTLYGGSGKDTLYGGANNDLLYGNADNDKLFGDSGNDTLDGGAGNDTLKGGAGKDVFIYRAGEGNDVITDYSASQGDKIQIVNGTIKSTTYKNNDVIYKIGSNTLTIKNAKNQNISKEYIDDTQIYSRWFSDDDNNFISNDANIDSISEITADTYSAGNIQTADYSNLAQNDSVLAYSNNK